ncbi:MAG TPA: hypothetical protein VFI95_24215 [Terriglobales bacterium]|nr:hypothetical protein [Terriglobales bacterium]
MLPWTDGFRWTVSHVVFLSLFFAVVVTIMSTVAFAVLRAAHDLQQHSAAEICWRSNFAELSKSERRCRHELAGRVISRTCDNAFDCRHCDKYPRFAVLPATGIAHDLGINYSSERFYHRGHTWVEPQEDGSVAIGLDELAENLIGTPDCINMPETGSELDLNGIAWRMEKNGNRISIRAPLEGTVVARGGPKEGWYLKIRPRLDLRNPATLRHLLHGREVQSWLYRELERLQLQLRSPGFAASLADGGVLVRDLMNAAPEADWETVLAGTFLQP